MELPEIFRSEKILPVGADWKARPRDEWMRLVCPIDINGGTVEGLRFTISANTRLPDEAVTFQIEYHPPRGKVKGGPLARFEWRPVSAHNNKGMGPPEYQYVVQNGCHFHSFEANWEEAAPQVRRGGITHRHSAGYITTGFCKRTCLCAKRV
jgi:hypothetical protein